MACAEWESLSHLFVIVAFALVALGMAGAGRELTGVGGAVEALIICAFFSLFSSFILTALIKWKAITNSREIQYSTATVCYLTVLLLVIAIAVYGFKKTRKPTPFATALLITGALCATLGGTFTVLLITEGNC